MTRPVVSVVISFLDERALLPAQLAALAEQRLDQPWELIAVDDGSSDGSASIVRDAMVDHGWSGRVVLGPGQGPGPARNAGVAASSGELICFCDADDVVAPGWLDALVSALESAPIVAGVLDRVRLNGVVERAGRAGATPTFFAPSCNMGVRRSIFDQLGGFAAEFRQGGDVDFGLRARALGYEVATSSDAIVHYRLRQGTRRAYRQAVRSGRAREKLRRRHDVLDVLAPTPSLRRQVAWVITRMPTVVRADRRRRWIVRAGTLVGQGSQRLAHGLQRRG